MNKNILLKVIGWPMASKATAEWFGCPKVDILDGKRIDKSWKFGPEENPYARELHKAQADMIRSERLNHIRLISQIDKTAVSCDNIKQ